MVKQDNHVPINPIARLILVGYIALAILTFLLLDFVQWARDLFVQTFFLIEINGVWFSAAIVGYGFYALRKNMMRVKMTGVKLNLTPQYLIVSAFFFFFIKQVIDLILFYGTNLSSVEQFALTNVAIVVEFGGFVAGVASIYYSRKG